MSNTYPVLRGKTYFIRTFGCQMNMHDSERVSGLLDECGLLEVATPEEADVVVFMTCCVRENADTRLYGQASAMVSAPVPPSGRRVVAVGGCIAQRDGADGHGSVGSIVNDGRKERRPFLIADHLRRAADHARHERIGGAEVNAHRQTVFMGRSRQTRLCNLK